MDCTHTVACTHNSENNISELMTFHNSMYLKRVCVCVSVFLDLINRVMLLSAMEHSHGLMG